MTVRELITKIGFKVDQGQLNSAKDSVKSVGKAGLAVAGIIVGAVSAVGGFAIGAAADMEMMGTQFEVMLGSEEKAIALMDELRKLAASTPFELADLGQGAQQLLSFGVQAQDVTNTMRMLGDTAGGNAEKLSGLVLAYGKVQTKGKASMEELNMMAERGLPVFTELTKLTGKQGEELFKMISAGDISKDTISQMFQKLTSEGGMFYKGMEKQSLTFTGLVSTMKDAFKELGADAGAEILPRMKEFVKTITEMLQGDLGNTLKEMVKNFMPIIESLFAFLPTLFGLVNSLLPVLKLLTPVFDLLIGVVAYIMPLINMVITLIAAKLVPMLTNAVNFITTLLQILGPSLQILISSLEPLLGFLMDIVNLILYIATIILQKLAKPLQIVFEALVGNIFGIFKWLGEQLSLLVKNIFDAILWVIKLANKIPGVNIDTKGLEKMRNDFGNFSMEGLTSKKVNQPTVNNIVLNQTVSVEQNALKNSSATAVRDAATGATQAAFSDEIKKLLVAAGA